MNKFQYLYYEGLLAKVVGGLPDCRMPEVVAIPQQWKAGPVRCHGRRITDHNGEQCELRPH